MRTTAIFIILLYNSEIAEVDTADVAFSTVCVSDGSRCTFLGFKHRTPLSLEAAVDICWK